MRLQKQVSSNIDDFDVDNEASGLIWEVSVGDSNKAKGSPNRSKLCPLQAEKVCGPQTGGPASLSSHPALSHASASSATSVTSERWGVTAGPAANQRLQDRSNRWDKLM